MTRTAATSALASAAIGIAAFAWVRRGLADASGLRLAPDPTALALFALAGLAGLTLALLLPAARRTGLAWTTAPLAALALREFERTALLPAGAGRWLAALAAAGVIAAWLTRRVATRPAAGTAAAGLASVAALAGSLAATVAPAVLEDATARVSSRAGVFRRDMRHARRFARGVIVRSRLDVPPRRPILAVTARAERPRSASADCELRLAIRQDELRLAATRPLLRAGSVSGGEQDGFVRIRLPLPAVRPGTLDVDLRLEGGCAAWSLAELRVRDASLEHLLAGAQAAASSLSPCGADGVACRLVAADGEVRPARLLACPDRLILRIEPAPLPGTRLVVPLAVPDELWTDPIEVAVELAGEDRARLTERIERGEDGWHELAVAAPRARDGALELRVIPSAPAGSVLAVGEIGRPRPAGGRGSIVLASIDTLRADRVDARRMPHLAALAARGARFTRATATSPWTMPSHAALFASRPAGDFGAFPRPDTGPPRFELATPLLAEVFAAAGWETVAFTGGAYVSALSGFARGFARYRDAREQQDDTGPNLDRIARWLASRPPGPFFLFFHTYRTHDPYFESAPPLPAAAPGWEHDAARYDEAVSAADAALGRLLALLDEAGALRDAWVIVLSDHGEEFGERVGETSAFGHGHTLYEELLAVPLVLAGPAIPRGRQFDTAVSLLDVAPTLVELAGLPVPSAWQGQSLLALAGPAAGGAREVALDQFPWHGFDRRGIRLGATKLIVSRGDRPEAEAVDLFDLDADPGERRPLPLEACEVAGWLLPRALARFEPDAGPGPAERSVPEHLLEQLRALGYLQ